MRIFTSFLVISVSLGVTACDSSQTVVGSASTSKSLPGSGNTVRLSFLAPATPPLAGTCSDAFTAALVDSSGQSVQAATDLSLDLVLNGAGAFYSDSNCSTVATHVSITAGQASAPIYFKASLSGFAVGYANSAIYGVATLPFRVNPGVAGALLVTGPTTTSLGGCSTGITASVTDSLGNSVVAPSLMTLTLGGAGAGTYYSNSTCSSVISTINIPAGSTSATFYFKDPTSETLSLAVSKAGLTTGNLSLIIAAAGGGGGSGAPAKLMLLAGANSTAAMTCYGPITSQVADTNGNPSIVASNTTISLTGSGTGAYYSDNACTAAVTSMTVNSGTSSQVVYFKGSNAENDLFAAAAAGLTSTTLPFGVIAGAPTKLVVSGPTQLGSGSCSPAFMASLQDLGSNLAKSVGATTVNLSGAGAGTFYSDSSCTTSITTIGIASNASSASVYFKDLTQQNLVLSAAAAGLTSGTLGLTVTAGTAAKLVLGLPASPAAGLCSQAVVITSQDLNGNVSTVAGATAVTLSGQAHGVFYSDSACATSTASVTIGAGTSSKSFYVLDTTAESLSLSVSATSFVPGSGALTVSPNVLTKLSVAGTTAINASTCSGALTITAQDAQSNSVNVASNTVINLSGAGAGGAFYSDNACTSVVTFVTVGTGTSNQVFYYKTTSAGSPVLAAASAGLTSGTLTMSVTGLPATKLVITGPSPIAVNACSSAYTVTARDSSNNITNVSSSTSVGLSGGQAVFYTDSSCTLPVSSVTLGAGSSTFTVYLKDVSGEALTLTASASGLTSGTLAVTQTAPALSSVQLLAGTYDSGGGNDSATGALQRFNSANSITGDGTNLYVSDHFGIHKTPLAGGAWTTFAGSIGNAGSADGTGSAANLNNAAQMTILAGNMYVADNGNFTIRKIVLATGVVTTLAGAPGGNGTTDGTGGAARFYAPNGITNDGTNLYVSDTANHCIRKITTAGVVTTLAGLCGSGGSSDNATASSVRFNNPLELIAVGPYLYVADFSNYAIRQVTIATGATTTFAGQTGAGGSTDAAGNAARFNQPYGMSTDGTNLYVGDQANHVVRQIVISSAVVTTIAGNYQRGYADGTAGLGKFNYPAGTVAVAGSLYIVDRGNGMIRTLNLGSGNLSTLAGPSASLMAKLGGLGNQDGVGASAQFNNATSAVEVNGYLYVTDQSNHKIRRVAIGSGTTVSFVGSGAIGYQDGAYSGSRFFNPNGITSDGVNLFVADQSNHCIRKIVIATGMVSTLDGSCGNVMRAVSWRA